MRYVSFPAGLKRKGNEIVLDPGELREGEKVNAASRIKLV
jgi:hypothetical protein